MKTVGIILLVIIGIAIVGNIIFWGTVITASVLSSLLSYIPILPFITLGNLIFSGMQYYHADSLVEKLLWGTVFLPNLVILIPAVKISLHSIVRKHEDYKYFFTFFNIPIIVNTALLYLLSFNFELVNKYIFFVHLIWFILNLVLYMLVLVFLLPVMEVLVKLKAINQWKKEAKDLAVDIAGTLYKSSAYANSFSGHRIFSYDNMPYGRAMSFLGHFKEDIMDEDYYIFYAEKTKDPYEMRENGILATMSGIYFMSENKEGKLEKEVIPYESIWNYDEEKKEIKMLSENKLDIRAVKLERYIPKGEKVRMVFSHFLKNIVDAKLPQYISYYGYEAILLNETDIKDVLEFRTNTKSIFGEIANTWAGLEQKKIYQETKGYMDGRQGHGYAAEYGLNTLDKVKGLEVINEAQNLDSKTGRQVKDGADRIQVSPLEGLIYIQTKYTDTFGTLYSNITNDGKLRYWDPQGNPMKIEVPRDKYMEFADKLQTKIDSGVIDTKGKSAREILKKGSITYNSSVQIAKAGTVESITMDALSGVVTTTFPATISALLTFVRCYENTEDSDKSVKMAIQMFNHVMMVNVASYVATMQLTRENNNMIYPLVDKATMSIRKNDLVQKLGLGNITNKELVSNTIFWGLAYGPDLFKFLNNKISGSQLVKNMAVTGGTVAATALAGAAFGGPIGFLAGLLAAPLLQAAMDSIIEDDNVKMFYVFKEEFIDCITTIDLGKGELEQIIGMTVEHDDFSKFLSGMYASSDERRVARQYINQCIQNVYNQRQHINNEFLIRSYIDFYNSNNETI